MKKTRASTTWNSKREVENSCKQLMQHTAAFAGTNQINCEVFGAWISSGLEPDRLTAKLGRLLGQLTGRISGGDGGGGAKKKKDRAKEKKRRLKGGVRGLFEKIDQDAAGTVSRHDMKVNRSKSYL